MRKLKLYLFIISFSFFQHAIGVPAYPFPVKITQPDGTTLTVVMKGDEFNHYHESEDGYLLKKGTKGHFNYAKLTANGNILDTEVRASDIQKRLPAEREFLGTLQQNVSMHDRHSAMRAKREIKPQKIQAPQRSFPLSGSPRSLVILVNFSDVEFVTANPQQAFFDMLNESGYSKNGGTGSARDYFIDNSMGRFNPDFDVVGPYTLPRPMKYYGENDEDGYDKEPVQMVVDACKAAFNDGVDFSLYDTDNNRIVDNIFIYYAGHNEAEWGGEDTVWPHRWGVYPNSISGGNGNYSGSTSSVTFNGVRIQDYACTSELKGNSGNTMAGIGTFVHEFSHVLGLVDMYPTDEGSHHTLSSWSVMDAGPYLNDGRTPPAYNAFERFQLGFLVPEILKDPISVELPGILSSNEAYLISPTDVHNLNRHNPTPKEFFLLENRQKTGWDTFLPGHGMLIYRINFVQDDFYENTVNNIKTSMGVDLIEADKIANNSTLAGDPFPGSRGVEEFTPQLLNGTLLNEKQLTFIEENEGVISFRYRGGGDFPILRLTGDLEAFNTIQGTPSALQQIDISGERLIEEVALSFSPNTHYEMKLSESDDSSWAKVIALSPTASILSETSIDIRYNPTVPSYHFIHAAEIQANTTDGRARLAISGKSTRPIYVVPPVATDATNISDTGFVANWNAVDDATGYYISLYEIKENEEQELLINDEWVVSNSYNFTSLFPGTTYAYNVKASDLNTEFRYENITEVSNTIEVTLNDYPQSNILRLYVQNDEIHIFLPETGGLINIYNIYGQLVRSVKANKLKEEISNLHPNNIYFIKYGKRKAKIIL